MPKKIVAMLCIVLCLGVVFMPKTFARTINDEIIENFKTTDTGVLILDGREILNGPPVLFTVTHIKSPLLPVRTFFEEMGAENIQWHSHNRTITFEYKNNCYEITFQNEYSGDGISIDNIIIYDRTRPETITIFNEKVPHSILLNPMASIGLGVIIHDRLYVAQQTAEYLTRYFGYDMKVDRDLKTVYLTKNNTVFDPTVGEI